IFTYMKIAFLGLGKMGTAVAGRLLLAGHSVCVWNRSPKSLKELRIPSATLAPSVRAAVESCDVVCTMLANDEATEAVAFGPEGFLAALRRDAAHIALGTLSVALSRRLMESHAAADQRYVAAPVFGRPNIAEQGRLWIVAAGDDSSLEYVRTVLDAIGRGVTIVGNEPPQAHAFKLGGNFMISAMVQTLSEAFVFASAEGIHPELFLETINEALFQSPFYLNYGRVMMHPPQHPGATVLLGEKDIRLFREATQSAGLRLGLAEYLQEQFNLAIRNGLGSSDWAVGQYRMAEQGSKI
ncbi:MAG TPA: NAD(P)-dependent oxidoreductase, partial [Acidobacteriaceae bacterium]|nr:NAD(P)-dependent oxidoreductase [Acidobacteriaceae bacterium]